MQKQEGITHDKIFVYKYKQRNYLEAQLKNATNTGGLPSLISDVIVDSKHYIDNILRTHGGSKS